MKKFNLESYKDLLIEMNEKPNFRFDELSQTRWDVFNVLKTNGYIKKVDRAVYTWAGRKPKMPMEVITIRMAMAPMR